MNLDRNELSVSIRQHVKELRGATPDWSWLQVEHLAVRGFFFLLLLCGTLLLFLGPFQAYALQVRGLKTPQSFVADPDGKGYFISNINGQATARDNNGFITKLDQEGKILDLQFIQGGQGDTVLHAPKGMAVVNKVLYVADLDTLRGFDRDTGRSIVTVRLPHDSHASQDSGLTDVASDGHGILYVSDTQTNTIYRIDINQGHAVSVLVQDVALAGPRGLALHPKTGHLIVVSFDKGKILDVDQEGAITVLVSNTFFSSRFQNLDGVGFDVWGRMYVSDVTAGTVWRMTPNQRFDVIAEYLPTPGDIGIDRANHLILVPYVQANAAEMNGLESPIKSKKRKRTLADYGFTFKRPKLEEPPDE